MEAPEAWCRTSPPVTKAYLGIQAQTLKIRAMLLTTISVGRFPRSGSITHPKCDTIASLISDEAYYMHQARHRRGAIPFTPPRTEAR